MMYCRKCGKELPDDALFCQKCGTKVITSSSPAAPPVESMSSSVRPVPAQDPGRGTLILVLGILSLVLLGPFTGIPAWVMGSGDLKQINSGGIAQSARGMTKAGMILGIIGTFLVILFVILGIVAAVGITMFSDSAINANRDALSNDLVNLASRAQQFYQRPVSAGGGGESFDLLTTDAITLLTSKPVNANGTYSIEVAGQGSGADAVVVIMGVGNETHNGEPVAVRVFVWPDRDSMVTIN